MFEGFTVPVRTLAGAVLAFLAGATCPTYYATERFRGFGRTVLARLPYRAPPGMSEEEALEAALESAEDHHETEEESTDG